MKVKFAATIAMVMISINAQAQDVSDISAYESYSPSSNQIAPARDLDNLYSIPISSREKLSVGGDVNFQPNLDEPQEAQAKFSLNYSMNF